MNLPAGVRSKGAGAVVLRSHLRVAMKPHFGGNAVYRAIGAVDDAVGATRALRQGRVLLPRSHGTARVDQVHHRDESIDAFLQNLWGYQPSVDCVSSRGQGCRNTTGPQEYAVP